MWPAKWESHSGKHSAQGQSGSWSDLPFTPKAFFLVQSFVDSGVCFNRSSSLFSLAQVCILTELPHVHSRIFFCSQSSRYNLLDKHLLIEYQAKYWEFKADINKVTAFDSSVPTHMSYGLPQGQSLLLLDSRIAQMGHFRVLLQSMKVLVWRIQASQGMKTPETHYQNQGNGKTRGIQASGMLLHWLG